MLPTELFISIFALCAQNDSLSPYTLSRVCRSWREIVHNCPQLWQDICITDNSEPSWRRLAHLWLERAKPLQLSLEMDIDANSEILPLLIPFLSCLSRVAKIKPGVDHDWVEVDSHRWLERSDGAPVQVFLDFMLLQPDLEDIEPLRFNPTECEGYISIRAYQLPHLGPDRRTDTLRFLRLTEYTDFMTDLAPHEILSFVSSFPQLDYFRFDGWCHPYEPCAPLSEPVVLKQLKLLTLHETCMARPLLSELYTPVLSSLALSTLNIGFALDEYESSLVGDSDDESNDPSQSPWSDHATGMGLRLWIQRTIRTTGYCPILERLAMDMSDLRTKDFLFVFDHLELLGEFLITGSDMSDTVVGFLGPFSLEDPTDPEKMVTRLRLPRLRTAWFGECNRFSGEVVVKTFTERLHFTDTASQENIDGHSPFGTLQYLGIGGCQLFYPRHEDALREVLGERFDTRHPDGATHV
ncbi:hypothetical protein BDV98DRAFT_571052, partial [Pterulicium gracile]